MPGKWDWEWAPPATQPKQPAEEPLPDWAVPVEAEELPDWAMPISEPTSFVSPAAYQPIDIGGERRLAPPMATEEQRKASAIAFGEPIKGAVKGILGVDLGPTAGEKVEPLREVGSGAAQFGAAAIPFGAGLKGAKLIASQAALGAGLGGIRKTGEELQQKLAKPEATEELPEWAQPVEKTYPEIAKSVATEAAQQGAIFGAAGAVPAVLGAGVKGAKWLGSKASQAVSKMVGLTDEVAPSEITGLIRGAEDKLKGEIKQNLLSRIEKLKGYVAKKTTGIQQELPGFEKAASGEQPPLPLVFAKDEQKLNKVKNLIGKLEQQVTEEPVLKPKDTKRFTEILDQDAKAAGVDISGYYKRGKFQKALETFMEPGQKLAEIDRKYGIGAEKAYNSLMTSQGKSEIATVGDLTKFAKTEAAQGLNKVDQNLVTELLGFIDKDGNVVAQRMVKNPKTKQEILVKLNKARFGKDYDKIEQAAKLHRSFYNEALDQAAAAGKPIPQKDFYAPLRYKPIPGVSGGGSFRPDIDPAFLHHQSGKGWEGRALETDAKKLLQRYTVEKNRYLYQSEATRDVLNAWARAQATGNENAIRGVNDFIEKAYGIKNPKEFGRQVGRAILDEDLEHLYNDSFDVGSYMYKNLLAYNLKGMIRNAMTPLSVGIPEVGSKSVTNGFLRFILDPKKLKEEARAAGLIIPFQREEVELAKKGLTSAEGRSLLKRAYTKFDDAGMRLWEKSEAFTRLWMFSTGKDMAINLPKEKLLKAAADIWGKQSAKDFSLMYDKMGKEAFSNEFGKLLSDKVNLVYSRGAKTTFQQMMGVFGQFAKWNMRQGMNIAEDLARGRHDVVAKKLAVPYMMMKLAEAGGLDLGDLSPVGGGGRGGAPLGGVVSTAVETAKKLPEAIETGEYEKLAKQAGKAAFPLIPKATLVKGVYKGVTQENPFGLIKKKPKGPFD